MLHAPAAYQPLQQARFDALAPRLQAWLPQARIEHIGASSISGACSKGDLDVLVAVDGAQLEAARAVLVAQGYVEKLDTLRTPELCMLESAVDQPEHALQLVARGSGFERNFLGFRDRLRAAPERVAAYNALKQAHAGQSDAEYRAAKSRFIESVLEAMT
ncbi:GrpB family protein [Inhella gelatinilytica]|nr:GrpB family protein [Inhella gelatinilytica]